MEIRYFRFVITRVHAGSGNLTGVFQMQDALGPRTFAAPVKQRVARHFRWFNRNLVAPELAEPDPRVIFWFRPDAGEPLHRMRALATWLRSRGITIVTLQTTDPGEIVYSDAHQVAARPRQARIGTSASSHHHRPRPN